MRVVGGSHGRDVFFCGQKLFECGLCAAPLRRGACVLVIKHGLETAPAHPARENGLFIRRGVAIFLLKRAHKAQGFNVGGELLALGALPKREGVVDYEIWRRGARTGVSGAVRY